MDTPERSNNTAKVFGVKARADNDANGADVEVEWRSGWGLTGRHVHANKGRCPDAGCGLLPSVFPPFVERSG